MDPDFLEVDGQKRVLLTLLYPAIDSNFVSGKKTGNDLSEPSSRFEGSAVPYSGLMAQCEKHVSA
jgi:hypothetical protein